MCRLSGGYESNRKAERAAGVKKYCMSEGGNSRLRKRTFESTSAGGGFHEELYIVFKDKILKYRIGNQSEKDYVCSECRKMGILDTQMNWSE